MNILSWFKKPESNKTQPEGRLAALLSIKCPKCPGLASAHPSTLTSYPLEFSYPLKTIIYEKVPEYQDGEGFWHCDTIKIGSIIKCWLTQEDILLNYQKGVRGEQG